MNSDGVAYIRPSMRGRSRRAQTDSNLRPEAHSGPEPVRISALLGGFLTDNDLLVKVGQGSKDALALLFRRHRSAVLHVAFRILKDEGEAEDLCQDVFLLLVEKARLFDPVKGSAISWIIQFAYHRAMNRRRYLVNRRQNRVLELERAEELPAGDSPVTGAIDARALLERLREALPTDQRVTLELHLFEGYSLREIAEKTGQSIGNIRHFYYRGLERLRTLVFPARAGESTDPS